MSKIKTITPNEMDWARGADALRRAGLEVAAAQVFLRHCCHLSHGRLQDAEEVCK